MKGMDPRDLEAIKTIGHLANLAGEPLVDVSKFPFFGGRALSWSHTTGLIAQ